VVTRYEQQFGIHADFGKPNLSPISFALRCFFGIRVHRCEETNCTLLHMPQEQSASKRTIPKRLEALRLAKRLTWDGVAGLLEVSPSLIYQAKRGERNLGDLVLHRLEEAEIESGLLNVQDASFARLLRNPELAQTLEPGDSNQGSHDNYIKMRLEVLADVVCAYDSAQITELGERLKKLAVADKQFGKVFDQMADVVGQLQFRKELQEQSLMPRTSQKKK